MASSDKKEVAPTTVDKKKTEQESEEDEESYEYVTNSEAGSGEEGVDGEEEEDEDGEEEEEEEEEDEEEVIEETVTQVVRDAEKKVPVAAKTTQSQTTTTSGTQKGTETKSVSSKLTTKTTTTVKTSSASKKTSEQSSTSTSSNSKSNAEDKKQVKELSNVDSADSKAVVAKEESSSGAASSQESGESLLLPLLQGLLHKNSSQRSLNAKEQNMSETMVPHVEDSGTESGEDLRLLAAGLQNAMHRNSQGNLAKGNKEMGLLEEVTAALERLEISLKAGADMNMHKGKKQNLLLLVSRLKNGLIAPDKLDESPEIEEDEPNFEEVTPERRMSGQGRFARRKNRNNRHTVGVSREELADARQLMEDMIMRKSIPNMETAKVTAAGPTENYALQKQLSLGAVLYRPNQFVPEDIKKPSPAALPQFPTPVTYYQEKKPKFKFIRQSLSLDQGPEVAPLNSHNRHVPETTGRGILKFKGNADRRLVNPTESESSGEEFEPGQTNGFDYDQEEYRGYPSAGINNNKPGYLAKGKDRRKVLNRCRTPPGPVFDTPVYQVNMVNKMMTSDEDACRRRTQNKFSKKLRMKRANTIDIPKPLGFASTADESDEDDESMTQSLHQSRPEQPLGLKKTIDVGDKVKSKRAVPKFKPQTENDHKFLAFIQRQTPQHGSTWINPNTSSNGPSHCGRAGQNNWTNKFGNIKNTFEKPKGGPAANWGPTSTVNANKSARNFWHNSESKNSKFPSIPPFTQAPAAHAADNHKSHHPHLPRSKAASAAWKQRTMSQPEIMHYEPEHIVTGVNGGGMRIRDAEFVPPCQVEYFNQPLQTNGGYFPSQHQQSPVKLSYQAPPPQVAQFEPPKSNPIYQPQPVVMPKPMPVNNFSHNPGSAFKPIPKKIQPIPAFKPIETPEPIINNVKKFKENYNQMDAKAQAQSIPAPTRNVANNFHKFSAGNSPVNKSPTLPWTSKPVFENRVLNLATTKFDQGGKVSPRTQTGKYKSPTNNMISSFSGVSGYSPVRAPSGPNKMLEKRPSLPNTSYPFYYEDDLETMKNTRMNENLFTENPSYVPPMQHKIKSDPPSPRVLSRAPHSHSLHDLRQPIEEYHAPPPSNYVVTDYTPQSCVSTCVPTWHLTEPDYGRDEVESITNPNGQPLVLTCNQPTYSPSQMGNNGYHQQEALKIFDYPSPIGGSSNNETNDEWDDEPELTDSTEYKAVSSRVMTGPVQQTAVTVANKVKKRFDDEERDSKAAKSLHSVLKTIKKTPPKEVVDPFKSNEIMGGQSDVISRKTSLDSNGRTPSKSPNVVSGVPQSATRNDNMFSQYPVASVTNAPKPMMPAPAVKASASSSQPPVAVKTILIQSNNLPDVGTARESQKIVLSQSVQQTPPTVVQPPVQPTQNKSPLPPKSPNSLAQYRVPEIPHRPPQIVETPATPQTQNVPSHAVFNNVSRGLPPRDPQIRQSFTATESSESRFNMRTNENGEIRGFNVGGSALSKSDSWHQICQITQGKPPSPVPTRSVQRAKSGHNLLSLPKQYEGGIDKDKLKEKQRTVSAYFGATSTGGEQSSSVRKKTTTTTTINRIKTSEKASVGNQKPSSGLCRSNTMPSMASTTTATAKLDDLDIDDAFEDLFNTAMQ